MFNVAALKPGPKLFDILPIARWAYKLLLIVGGLVECSIRHDGNDCVWLLRLVGEEDAVSTWFAGTLLGVLSWQVLRLPCCKEAKLNGGTRREHSGWSATWSWHPSPGASVSWVSRCLQCPALLSHLPAPGHSSWGPRCQGVVISACCPNSWLIKFTNVITSLF